MGARAEPQLAESWEDINIEDEEDVPFRRQLRLGLFTMMFRGK